MHSALVATSTAAGEIIYIYEAAGLVSMSDTEGSSLPDRNGGRPVTLCVICRQVGSAVYLARTGAGDVAEVGDVRDMPCGLPLTASPPVHAVALNARTAMPRIPADRFTALPAPSTGPLLR